jgi:16S rRNA (adenine1518-N6/adenine1519-N6)-dimethyltransferase
VANIPYNITSPLILRLLKHQGLFSALHLTVQREVADRLTAMPGSKAYGALTLACQYGASVRRVLPIHRTAFYPVPEVDSALVRFELLKASRVRVSSAERLFGVIRAAFGQRRKMLRNTLCHAGWRPEAVEAALARSGIAGDRRGETLTLEEFAQLCEALPVRTDETSRESEREIR